VFCTLADAKQNLAVEWRRLGSRATRRSRSAVYSSDSISEQQQFHARRSRAAVVARECVSHVGNASVSRTQQAAVD